MTVDRRSSRLGPQGRGASPLCLVLPLWLCLASCRSPEPATAVLVVVDGDEDVANQLTSLEFRAVERSGERSLMPPYKVSLSLTGASRPLPLSLSLAAKDSRDSDLFRVEATGLRDGEAVVRQAALVKFRKGVTQRLDLYFARKCMSPDRLCGEAAQASQVCDSATGECRAIPEYAMLPVAGDGPLGGYVSVDGPDGDRDGGQEGGATRDDSGLDTGVDRTDGSDASQDSGEDDSGEDDAGEDDADEAGKDAGETDSGARDHGEDDCIDHACAHGLCVDGAGSYSCDCGDTGYQGDLCNEDIDECAGDNLCSGVAATGVAFSYPCEDTKPYYACPGMFPDWKIEERADRYSVNGDVVTDKMTGLQWLEVEIADVPIRETGASWQQAESFCADQTAADGGWRLPTLSEALSITDFSVTAWASLLPLSFTKQRTFRSTVKFVWTRSSYVGTTTTSDFEPDRGHEGVWVVGQGPGGGGVFWPVATNTGKQYYDRGAIQCVR